jgi:ribosomal protein S18 acetylase RimI-like enzyme
MADNALLRRLETYYDAVPRGRADPQEIGPFTLFVARSGWPYYARPRLGDDAGATVGDLRRVLERQRQLEVPLSFEWVDETTPGLEAVAVEAGLTVERCPLLVLDGEPRGDAGTARMLGPGEGRDLALSRAAISVGFETGGTATGSEGVAARDTMLGTGFAVVDDEVERRLGAGAIRAAACYPSEQPDLGPVGGGSHAPVDEVTEIAGVGVLPAFRRRGLAAAVTFVLARDALDNGVTTVFCSAQSRDVARIYERVGFRAVATACSGSYEDADGGLRLSTARAPGSSASTG